MKCHFYWLYISFPSGCTEARRQFHMSINAVGVADGISNEIKAQFPLNCS